MDQNPFWYKDAVIYQAHVRAFLDTNHDGVGDFRGFFEKLEYVQELGVDTIWLLPFYPSPLKDDGYDTADYENIHPAYGTLTDFDRFIEEAHRRGLRVITELVINHTSDQHPWFQAARRAPAGSRERNFYVWSDTNQKYQSAPVIFSDSEKSNWSWDDTAGAYYWHRFFHHQPDLNYDNPAVVEAVVKVMRFWLDRGVDGLRLDAVPYLIEREGTICANLEETHHILKHLRHQVDAQYRNRLLLAEANQWPADVRPYFGDGDECHMAFHFPLMPRIFMAVRQEDRHPIVEILRQTPDIPESCQWGLFLRNHDELTLEMVTDEERDYMYQTYAADPQMRINDGIRRRLAPLMENSRRRIELMTSLLLSLPGTPVLYYGDELGMGDNIYLGDRNGVRTPMQWTGDRNAGFSRADAARLFAPLIADPVYGYQAINVEAQERSPFSLLNWMKRMISLRRQHPVFGRGTIEFLSAQNRKVLAYVRRYGDDIVLCVANLSRSVQPVELDLSRLRGMTPVEMLGQAEFPRIGEHPYFLSLGAYAFNWFRLQQAAPAITERTTAETPVVVPDLPTLLVGAVWDTLLDGTVRSLVERDLLGPFLNRQPWFQGPRPRAVRFIDWTLLARGPEPLFLTIVEDTTEERGTSVPRQYLVPLAASSSEQAKAIQERAPHAVLARITGARKGVLFDAWQDDRFAETLLEAITAGQTIVTRRGVIHARQLSRMPLLRRVSGTLQVFRPSTDPRSSVINYGNLLTLKLFRRVERGIHPEVEVTRHLSEDVGFTGASPVSAIVEYERRDEPSEATAIAMVAMAQPFVESQADAWTHTMDWLGRFFDQVSTRQDPLPAPEAIGSLEDAATAQPPPLAQEVMSGYLDSAAALGRRTAEMHLALATESTRPAFAPEPLSKDDLAAASQESIANAERVLQALEAALAGSALRVSPDVVDRGKKLLASKDTLFEGLRSVAALDPTGSKIRIHGDYRLGHVLLSGSNIYIESFEGHPSWPAAAQREKQSPLKDVAGMTRSLSYAGRAALITRITARPTEMAHMEPWARLWERWTTAAFLQNYLAGAANLGALDSASRDALLRFFMMDRAMRELDGELNNRPEWVGIPLDGLLQLLSHMKSGQK
jgi:maltose alpha-D-glucosyltransferase/alpha-amylase